MNPDVVLWCGFVCFVVTVVAVGWWLHDRFCAQEGINERIATELTTMYARFRALEAINARLHEELRRVKREHDGAAAATYPPPLTSTAG